MNRRMRWLGAAIVLLLAAVFLMHQPEKETKTARVEPRIPSHPTYHERELQRRRSRIVIPSVPPTEAEPEGRPEVHLDPMFVALGNTQGAVLEASAVLHSEIGQAIYSCYAEHADFKSALESFEKQAGFKLNDLDRVGFDGDVVVLSALRDGPPEVQGEWETISDRARINNRGDQVVALYGEDMMLFGPDASVRAALGRLESKTSPQRGALTGDLAYGEVYGRAGSDVLEALIGREDPVAARIREAVSGVEFHFDVQQDVAMHFEVTGEQADAVDDVAKSVAGVLSAARINASLSGQEQMMQLLDFTRISRRGDGFFSLDVVLPKDFVLERFEDCRLEDDAARSARPDEADASDDGEVDVEEDDAVDDG